MLGAWRNLCGTQRLKKVRVRGTYVGDLGIPVFSDGFSQGRPG